MELTYGQLETTLRAHLKIHPDKALTLRSRIKQLQRLKEPFPPGVNVGRGTRMLYTSEHLLQLIMAFELLSMGLPAQPACALVLTHWSEFSAGLALATLQDRRYGDDVYDVFAVMDVKAMNDIQFGWARKDASAVVIVDKPALLGRLAVTDFNQNFTKLTINLSGLLKNVMKTASETAGVKGASTWSTDFHAWLPQGDKTWINFADYYPDRSNLKIRQRLHKWYDNDPAVEAPDAAEEARQFALTGFNSNPF